MNANPPPTWVLLRGLTRESGHWGDFPSRLARSLGAPVRTLDLPGAGCLRNQSSPTAVAAIARQCRDALAKEPPVAGAPLALVGLSMGGLVVQHWARLEPQRVCRVVMINSSAAGLNPLWQRLRPAQWLRLLRLAGAWHDDRAEALVLAATSAQPDLQLRTLATWQDLRRYRPVTRSNALRQLLAAARCRIDAQAPAAPLLLLASAGDQLVNPACSQALARYWQVPVRVHPWAGHDLPLDDPAWVMREVADWHHALAPR